MALSRRSKRRLAALAAVLVACGAGAVGWKSIRAAQKERLVAEARQRGLDAFARGDLSETLDALSYYIQYEKDDVETLMAFGEARARVPKEHGEHLAEAIRYFKTSVALMERHDDPAERGRFYLSAQRRLIELFGQVGLRFELVQAADRVLEEDPRDLTALTARARALFIDRRFDEARAAVARLVEVDPDTLRWRELVLEIMQAQGVSPADILAQCDDWIAGHHGDGRFHVLKGAWLARGGKVDAALAEAETAARLGATTMPVLRQTVSLLDGLGRRDLAADVIAGAKSRFPTEQWVREATARRLWQGQMLTEALREIAETEAQFGSLSVALRRLKGAALSSAGRVDEAREALGALATAPDAPQPDRVWASALLARLDMRPDNWRRSLDAYLAALALQPDDPVLHLLAGEAFDMAGEDHQALESFARAFALDPDWMTAGLAYAEALLDSGQAEQAYAVSRAVLRRSPGLSAAPYLMLARAHLAVLASGGAPQITEVISGRALDIVDLLERLHEQAPGDRRIIPLLVEACARTGQSTRATRIVRDVLEAAQSTPEILLALVAVSREHDLGMDTALVDRAAQAEGESLAVAFARAEGLAAAGRSEEGLEAIDRALAGAPRDQAEAEATHLARIDFLLRTRHAQASQALADLLRRFPRSVSALTFALEQPLLWEQPALARAATKLLREQLGAEAQTVRLAEARLLLLSPDDEAQRSRAIVTITNVLEQSPDSLAALTLMAEALMKGGSTAPDRAAGYLQRALDLYPGQVDLYPVLIALLQQRGDFQAAQRYLTRFGMLVAHRPDLRQTEIAVLEAQGDLRTALTRTSQLVTEASPEADQLVLAAMHERAGEHARAEAVYRRLLAEPQPSDLVLGHAAEFLAGTGRFDEGAALLQTVNPAGGEAARCLRLGSFHHRHGRPDEAERLLRRAVELDPESAEARHRLAQYHLAVQDHDAARREAMHGLEAHPDHPGLRTTLALASLSGDAAARREAINLLRNIGEPSDALLAMLEVIERVPHVEGRAQASPDDLDQVRQLLANHPEFLPGWLWAVSLHADAGDVSAAIDLARRATSRFPVHPEPAELATQLLLRTGRWSEALVEAQEWRQRSLHDPLPVDVVMASIELELGRHEAAVAHLMPHEVRILAERDQAPQRVALWAKAMVLAGRYRDVAPRIEPWLAADARWRDLVLALLPFLDESYSAAALERVEAAMSSAAERLPVALAWNSLAIRFSRPEWFDRADRLAQDAAHDMPLRTQALFTAAAIAEARGDRTAAEQRYRQVLALDPRHAAALNNLAFVIAQAPGRAAEALALAEQAVAIAPDHPDLLDTLGGILLRLGRADQAEQALNRALAARPADIGIGVNLAGAFLAQRRYAEAGRLLDDLERRAAAGSGLAPALRERLNEARHRLEHARAEAHGLTER
jgi:tetratricopeptide (TPR) repeat protein